MRRQVRHLGMPIHLSLIGHFPCLFAPSSCVLSTFVGAGGDLKVSYASNFLRMHQPLENPVAHICECIHGYFGFGAYFILCPLGETLLRRMMCSLRVLGLIFFSLSAFLKLC
jgi:hypothetical protein